MTAIASSRACCYLSSADSIPLMLTRTSVLPVCQGAAAHCTSAADMMHLRGAPTASKHATVTSHVIGNPVGPARGCMGCRWPPVSLSRVPGEPVVQAGAASARLCTVVGVAIAAGPRPQELCTATILLLPRAASHVCVLVGFRTVSLCALAMSAQQNHAGLYICCGETSPCSSYLHSRGQV